MKVKYADIKFKSRKYDWWQSMNVTEATTKYLRDYPTMIEHLRDYTYPGDRYRLMSFCMMRFRMTAERARMFPYLRWMCDPYVNEQ